ncbi:hypothetical protein GW17_00040843, partial [Ensete ventricosum]
LTTTYYNKRFGQSQVQASGRSEDDAVGNTLGLRWELAEGIKSLLGWLREFVGRRLRLVGRLSGVAERLIESWEGIEKIARNTPGDHLKKAVILVTRECRRLPNCRRLNPTGILSDLHQHLGDSQRQKEVQGKVRVMEDELLKLS